MFGLNFDPLKAFVDKITPVSNCNVILTFDGKLDKKAIIDDYISRHPEFIKK